MKKPEKPENVFLANSTEINSCEVDIGNFQEAAEKLFLIDNVWCSPDFLEILEKIATKPIVSVKKRKVFIHETREYSSIPFLTLTPHGILNKQFIQLYSRKGVKEMRKILGALLAFFEQKKDSVDFFPRDGRTIVIAYIKQYPKGIVLDIHEAICIYFESDDNTWNISIKRYPLELQKGAVKFSLIEKVPKTFRKKYFWEK